jgi:8-oxo-dGTP pyrophosphatase MutT (NUDIX family)
MTGWPALAAACAHNAAARVAFYVEAPSGAVEAGSVARTHLRALRRWPHALQLHDQRVTLTAAAASRPELLAEIHAALRDDGLIVAWRNEPFPLFDVRGRALGVSIERAATRFWGTLTLGAHCNGYVADAQGRPLSMWIAQRAFDKATDPGMLDNLVGGGVPAGQSPRDTVIREAWEEAGLAPPQLSRLAAGRVLRLLRDIPEGLQREWIHVYDLELPAGLSPANQDGEVAGFMLHPLPRAMALAAGGEMTVDASLVALDFGLRHHAFDPAEHDRLQRSAHDLLVGDAQ